MAKLYIISPPSIELESFLPKLENAFKKYNPELFQLRLKDITASDFLAAAKTLQPVCQKHNVKFIVNDNPQIALDSGADGVHVGDEDMAVSKARKILGNDKIIGASCYNSLELARAAVKQGASYVSFGAFYPTTTKQAKSRAEIATLKQWKKESNIPVSVIGGIDFENMQLLAEAGADYICMISAIWRAAR